MSSVSPTIRQIIANYNKSYTQELHPSACNILNDKLSSILPDHSFKCKKIRKGSKLTVEIKPKK